MHFGYTDEQEAFRGVVRRFLEDRSPPAEVRRWMEAEPGHDESVWRQLGGELGLLGLHWSEEDGGQGFSTIELGIALQEMGRALLCAPYLGSCVLAATALDAGAEPRDKRELLPALASGEAIGALAWCEAGGRWDAESVALTATHTSGGVRLDGEKTHVLDGCAADWIVVVAREPGSRAEEGLGLYLVRGNARGLERRALQTLDATRKQAHLTLAGVQAETLAAPGSAAPALARVLDMGCVALASEMVGAAEKVLEATVDYAKTRVQFGRAIGSFQAIKHKCADLLVDVELARSAAMYAAAAAAEDDGELAEVAPLTKALCADAFLHAATESIQIHGGIGFTWEHDCHLYFKRARSSALLLGEPSWYRERLASQWLAEATP